MRTGGKFQNNSSYMKNMARQSADVPGLVVGVSGSSLDVLREFRPCDVIYEEQADDLQVDDNGNENQTGTLINNELLAQVNNNKNDVRNNFQDNERPNENKHLRITSTGVANMNKFRSGKWDDLTTASLSSTQKFSSSRCRLSNNLPATSSTSSATSLSNAKDQCDTTNDNLPEVLSGHLVLIVSNNSRKVAPLKSNSLSPVTPRSLTQSRFPVLVKIHGRGYGKYAIISGTRRHQALPPSCLKLKNTYITQSATNHSRFTVNVDSTEGKSYTFEASSPEKAKEWMQAFSSDCLQPRLNSQHPSESMLQPEQSTSDSKICSHSLNLSHLPLLPVLSESLDEDEDEE